jgi:hypothetical protein
MEAPSIEGHHLWREFPGAISKRMILFKTCFRPLPGNSMEIQAVAA